MKDNIIKEEWAWGGLEYPEVSKEDADILILGIPYAKSAFYRKGAHEAPTKIRQLAAVMCPIGSSRIDITDLVLKDLGDLVLTEDINQNYKLIFEAAKKFAYLSSFPIFLGGDHSITIPLVEAFSQTSPINFVMLDAHADLLDIFLDFRIGHANVLRRILEFENVHEVFLIGMRSLEKEELEMLSHPKIKVWTVDEFHEHDLSTILNIIPNTRTYLSIDIDVVDPAFAPGTGIPDPGGITSHELLTLVREIVSKINIVGMDLVEYAPAQDVVADITGFLCVKSIFEALAGLKNRNFK